MTYTAYGCIIILMESELRHARDIDPSHMKVNAVSALARLAGGLELYLAPTRAVVEAIFIVRENLHLALPQLILDKQYKSGLPHTVEISYTISDTSEKSSIAFRFLYEDRDEFYIEIDDILITDSAAAVLNPNKPSDRSSLLSREEQLAARTYPVSRQDLAKLIASMLQPSPTDEYKKVEGFDFLDRDRFYAITDVLRSRANLFKTERTYTIPDDIKTPITEFRCKENNGGLQYAQMLAWMNETGRAGRLTMDSSKDKLVRLDEVRVVGTQEIDFETPVNGMEPASGKAEYGPGYDDLHRLVGFANNLYGKIKPKLPIERLLGSSAADATLDQDLD